MGDGREGGGAFSHRAFTQVGRSVFGDDDSGQLAWRSHCRMRGHVTNDTALQNAADRGGRLEADERRVFERQARPSVKSI